MSVRARTRAVGRRLPLLAPVTVALAVGACGSGSHKTTTVSVGSITATTSQAPTTSDVGKTLRSGEIDLKVTKVAQTASLSYRGGTKSNVTPTGVAKTTQAPAHFQYVYVSAQVTNHEKAAINLACGTPLTVALADTKSNTYTPVEGLSQISGNPSCSAPLKPGASTTMTWAFLASSAGKISAFEFAAAGASGPTIVNL